MARLRIQRVQTTVAWAASGSISLELSPVPFTINAILLNMHSDITTGTATNYSDYWDRMLSRLNLVGMVNNSQRTMFDFSSLRLPYHAMRAKLGPHCPARPTVVANDQTNALTQFAYLFHLGAKPFGADGRYDPWDVTAGVPPVEKGQLTLGGTWGAAVAQGANVTLQATSSCFLEAYLLGVQPEPGDPVDLWMPRAFPVWSMRSPSLSATSTTNGTSDNVPAGGFLRSMSMLAYNGSNNPRDDQVFNSFRLYDQYNNRPVIEYGGRAGTADASGGDYKIAELHSQIVAGLIDAPRSENVGTPGVPALTQVTDEGLVFWPLNNITKRSAGALNGVDPLYGADMRSLATGDIRFDYGIADATGSGIDVLYERYELNPNHPANAGRV